MFEIYPTMCILAWGSPVSWEGAREAKTEVP